MQPVKKIACPLDKAEDLIDIYAIEENCYLVDSNYDFEANDAVDKTLPSIAFALFSTRVYDYAYMRESILRPSVLPDWDNLSTEEKAIMVEHFIYPNTFTQTDIDAFYTTDQQKTNWRSLCIKYRSVRSIRIEAFRQELSFYLTSAQCKDLVNTVDSSTTGTKLVDSYINYNLKYLLDWFKNEDTEGIDYTDEETVGFKSKEYYSDPLRDVFVNIVISGNYHAL